MSSEDREAQEDELLALASIYDEDEFRRAESAQGGEIRICLTLSQNFRVVMAGANGQLEYFVDFLPPVVLNFELPPDYPSASAPVFTLSCKWLSQIQLGALCKQLDEIWQECQGCVVLFSWMQFLKEETLSFLKIKSPLELKNTVIRRCDQKCLTLKNDEHGSKFEKDVNYDPRAIQDVESWVDVLPVILDFDQQQKQKCFDSKVYLCNICFLEKLGSDCLYFMDCKHVYCRACLKEYFEIQIREGSVQCLNCPEPKCPSVATPAQVKKLVGEDLFARYDRLLLQSSLDLMADVVYCPRPSCQTAVMQEPGCTMGVCSCCLYAFCTVCKLAYHGVAPCRVTAAKIQDLCTDYLKADEETKKFLEQRYGKAVIQKALDELESEDWLAKNTKPCPACGTHIQKQDGCNKMTCTSCRQYFCWLCMGCLSKVNPYQHFSNPSSKCFNRLFPTLDDDDEDDDED